uniref:Uncharacterized protein n=1 Tax=Arundo donax TaxID=35708 RepID=A0A0A9F9W2_ARUDO
MASGMLRAPPYPSIWGGKPAEATSSFLSTPRFIAACPLHLDACML